MCVCVCVCVFVCVCLFRSLSLHQKTFIKRTFKMTILQESQWNRAKPWEVKNNSYKLSRRFSNQYWLQSWHNKNVIQKIQNTWQHSDCVKPHSFNCDVQLSSPGFCTSFKVLSLKDPSPHQRPRAITYTKNSNSI